MASHRVILFYNGLVIVLVGIVTLGLSLFNTSIKVLFLPPCPATYPGAGFFFLVFQMLFYLAVMICLFTYGILRITQPDRPENQFILYSALFTGYFLFNEVFRTHVHLGELGVPKLLVVISYFGLAIAYGLTFWKQIHLTPYMLLFSGVALLGVAFLVEGLMAQVNLHNNNLEGLVEGIPKLLSGVNTALYFWFTCREKLLRSVNFSA